MSPLQRLFFRWTNDIPKYTTEVGLANMYVMFMQDAKSLTLFKTMTFNPNISSITEYIDTYATNSDEIIKITSISLKYKLAYPEYFI